LWECPEKQADYIWSAPAKRSGDGALDARGKNRRFIQSGVALGILVLATALQVAFAVL
jgi:hypothetical protein